MVLYCPVLIEYHLNVCKGKGRAVKAAVMVVIFLGRGGDAFAAEPVDELLFPGGKLLADLGFPVGWIAGDQFLY